MKTRFADNPTTFEAALGLGPLAGTVRAGTVDGTVGHAPVVHALESAELAGGLAAEDGARSGSAPVGRLPRRPCPGVHHHLVLLGDMILMLAGTGGVVPTCPAGLRLPSGRRCHNSDAFALRFRLNSAST